MAWKTVPNEPGRVRLDILLLGSLTAVALLVATQIVLLDERTPLLQAALLAFCASIPLTATGVLVAHHSLEKRQSPVHWAYTLFDASGPLLSVLGVGLAVWNAGPWFGLTLSLFGFIGFSLFIRHFRKTR